MEIKRIYLDENNSNVYLEAYIGHKLEHLKKKAILIIPGGGYSNVCFDREGMSVAEAFVPKGYNAFVLNYSVEKSAVYPKQLIEASLAIKHIRDNANEYNIDPEKVFAVGFSAGGHLCASLGTMWHRSEINEAIPDMPLGYNKPTGIMTIYPVISGISNPHIGSFKCLLDSEAPTKKELEYLSVELSADKNSSPAFIVHTANDSSVPVQNSLVLANAYANAKIPFELHIYPDGPHGLGLGNELTSLGNPNSVKPDFASWVEQADAWTEKI